MVEQVTRAVGMKSNRKKCATALMIKGVPRYGGAVEVGEKALPIASLENHYRYLGVMQNTDSQQGWCEDRTKAP